MGDFVYFVIPSKVHWQSFCGTLLDNFLQIDAIIGGIIFMGLLITFCIQSERKRLFGATVEEKRELGGTKFINKA
jgi:uncharacterized membrane protein